MYNKNFFILWPLLKKRKFNFEPFGWRLSCRYHYVFTNILNQCKAQFYMGIFEIFTENCFMHIIAFNPRTHKTPLLPFIVIVVWIIYLSFRFVKYMAATFQLTFPEVCWSNITVTTEVLKRSAARSPLRAATRYAKVNLIACMWCVKRNILGGCCPGGTECGAKQSSEETHIKSLRLSSIFFSDYSYSWTRL